MGLNPGEIRIIDPDDIAEMFMMTTHNMPLNYLVDQLKDDVGEVIFLGIQPDIVGFYYPMTQPIKDAVDTVYQRLAGWGRTRWILRAGSARRVNRISAGCERHPACFSQVYPRHSITCSIINFPCITDTFTAVPVGNPACSSQSPFSVSEACRLIRRV